MVSNIIDLAYNLTLLVALSVVSGFIRQRRGRGDWGTLLQGVLFGGAAVIGMMRPLVLGPGLIFDGRSVMIGLCGLFFGPWAVAIAGGMAALYRFQLGGMGTLMGILVIAASAMWGLLFHARWIRKEMPLSAGKLWAFGLLISGTKLLLMFSLPAGVGPGVIRHLGLPILLTFPLVTLLVGKILLDQVMAHHSIQALRESEAQNRALLSAIPDLIFLTRADGVCLAVHTSSPGLLYVPPETFLNRNLREVMPEPLAERYMGAISTALASGKRQDLDYTLAIAGEEKHFEARVVPCTEDTVVTIARDVTEQKRSERNITERLQAEEQNRQLQAQLHQAQKMESLGSLAGGVAHDMNNVLGAILGLASAHLDSQPPGSPARRAFETILKAAERGGKMVRSLLSLARQRPAEEKELDLNDILREEASLLERTTLSRIRLQMDLAPSLPLIRGDAGALTHAIINLCVNAVDAMPDAGTLTLRTRNAGPRWVEAQVEDTGCGMPKEVLEKALDPFFTTKEQGKGTGLGLSLVYSAIKAHGGEMEIQSEPGRGTRITLRFPACASSAPAAPPAAAPLDPEPTRTTFHVLLVDDDELIQSSVQAILQVLGHSVTVSPSGEDALAKLEGGLAPQIVILDMNMPGLGGEGTLPRLRALRPGTPVLLSTGRADRTAQTLLENHPGVTLLPKPFGMADLRKHLEDAIQG